MKLHSYLVRAFCFVASALGTLPAWSQETPHGAASPVIQSNEVDLRSLESIFSSVEKDLNDDPEFKLTGDKRATLKRLAGMYELKAKDGDGTAQFKIGAMYLEGIGVEVDFGQAASWFAMAGSRDHPLALLAEGKFLLKCRDDSRDSRLHEATITALGDIGPGAAPAVHLLEQEFERPDRRGRDAAIALGRIGAPGVQILSEALAGKDQSLHRSAAEGLAAAGEAARSALPVLTAAWKDDDPSVRRLAEQTLKRLNRLEAPK